MKECMFKIGEYVSTKGDKREVTKIEFKKGAYRIYWKAKYGETGISAESIFDDWFEGRYYDGIRRKKKKIK